MDQPDPPHKVTITLDGQSLSGREGQTIAGILMAAQVPSWRTSPVDRRPRGLFCGIGICFECVACVNGIRDVRLCQRRAVDGDEVTSQGGEAS